MVIPATASAPLILASESPRRASLLHEAGYEFTVVGPPLDEPARLAGNPPPAALAMALSGYKARSVSETVDRGLVLAADTVSTLQGEVFGKPVDRVDAERILQSLTGTTHDVITGVTLLDAATGRRTIRCDVTEVTMKVMSPRELTAYLDSGEWAGKAGAYGIQDVGDRFVSGIRGSFTNVMGLPMELLTEMMGRFAG